MTAPSDMLDPDRRLALSYIGRDQAEAVRTLWELDVALGQLLIGATSPMIVQMKLAWWREALARLDREPPPAEPLLQQIARDLLPAGLPGKALAQLADGWEYLVASEALDLTELDAYARLRGGFLFACTAKLLSGASDAQVERGGEAWALADLARHTRRPEERRAAFEAVMARGPSGSKWPARLRPLGMLAVLADRDARREGEHLERPGAPARMLRMLGHRLTGR